MTPDQINQNIRETVQIGPNGAIEAIQSARTKLLINTHDNNVSADETSTEYIKRKWHGFCVQAAIIAANELVTKYSNDYSQILLVSSHGKEGDYSGPLGDPDYKGHLVCLCQDKIGIWIILSPTIYDEENPSDLSSSIHTESDLSKVHDYLATSFGGSWPSAQKMIQNYETPTASTTNIEEELSDIKHEESISKLKITWVQKEIDSIISVNKELNVSIKITNTGNMPREYFYSNGNDFFTPLE